MTAVVDQRPLRRRAPVVENRLAHQLDVDAAVEAEDRAHEHVVAVLVGGGPSVRGDFVLALARADGQRVAHQHPAARRVPRRDEGVGTRLIDPPGWDVDSERSQTEGPRLAVEQGAEDAGRVEARHAEPVDRPIGGDKRAGVAVRQERVVRDRRERRRRRGALLRTRWLHRARGLRRAHDATRSCQAPCPAAGPHDCSRA